MKTENKNGQTFSGVVVDCGVDALNERGREPLLWPWDPGNLGEGRDMSNEVATRAARVAGTIGVFKWILMLIVMVAAVITLAVTIASGEASAAGIGFAAIVGGVLYSLMIWVLFGWFEHTLRALAEIAGNTAGLRLGVQPPGPYQQPPQ